MSVHTERLPRPRLRTRSRVHEVAESGEVAQLRATLLDRAGYWLGLCASYLVLMSLWYYAAEGKIIAGGFSAPAGVIKQFQGSFLASVAWHQRRVGDSRCLRGARVPRSRRQPCAR